MEIRQLVRGSRGCGLAHRGRARDELRLIVPQRFFTHGQNAYGDRHVYAAQTRFIPDDLLGLFDLTPLASSCRGTRKGH